MAKSSKIDQKTIQEICLRCCKLKLSRVELFQLSEIPVVTIESYEYGHRSTPQEYIDKLQSLYKRDREITARIIAGIEADIDRTYPTGIPSEGDKDCE